VFQDDPTHFIGCPKMSRTALTQRHNAIASRISAWCNSVGIPAFLEPKVDGQRRRPDIDIVLDGGRVLVDVSVVHPCAPSHIVGNNAMWSALGPLLAREAAKVSKYRALAQDARAELLPFVVSSFGGFGVSAMRLFAILRHQLSAMNPVPWSSDPVSDLIREICVMLQQGNSLAVVQGCHKAGVLLRQQVPVGPLPLPREEALPAAEEGVEGLPVQAPAAPDEELEEV
jgi:hypothetical protein